MKKEPQRQKPVWEDQATAVQTLLERLLAVNHLVTVGILPNVSFMSELGCKFGAECLFPHWKVEEQPNKKPKKGDDKSAVGIVKSVRQLTCVS